MSKELRNGNFTSSEIVALLSMGKRDMTPAELAARPRTGKGSKTTTIDDINSFGESALTYIEETNFERMLDRKLDSDVNSKPVTWGKMVEQRIFSLLGTEYKMCSTEVLQHPTIPFWCGTPDYLKYKSERIETIGDFKAPFTMKSFCNLVKSMDINQVCENHKEGEKYKWQVISNAVLLEAIHGYPIKYGEICVYCPYESELDDIREMVSNFDGNQGPMFWLTYAENDELPWIKDGGKFKNLNFIRWEIAESDKNFLIQRVMKAGELLIAA